MSFMWAATRRYGPDLEVFLPQKIQSRQTLHSCPQLLGFWLVPDVLKLTRLAVTPTHEEMGREQERLSPTTGNSSVGTPKVSQHLAEPRGSEEGSAVWRSLHRWRHAPECPIHMDVLEGGIVSEQDWDKYCAPQVPPTPGSSITIRSQGGRGCGGPSYLWSLTSSAGGTEVLQM